MPKTFRELHPYRHFIAWLLSVAVLAVVGMWLFNVIAKSEAQKAANAQAEASQHATDNAKTLTRGIKTRLENTFSNNTNLTFESTTDIAPIRSTDHMYVGIESSPAIKITWEESLGDEYALYIRTQLQESIKEILQNNLNMQPFNNNGASKRAYQNDTAICASGTDMYSQTSGYTIVCVDKSDTKKTIEAITPFATLHAAAQPNSVTNGMFYSSLRISNSPVEGYKHAAIDSAGVTTPGGGAVLLFYSVDDTWHFFTGSQQMLPCSEYNTLALQQAFKGTPCIDDTTSEARPL